MCTKMVEGERESEREKEEELAEKRLDAKEENNWGVVERESFV